MVSIVEIYTLGKTYPIVTLIIAALLFILGFKWAKKVFWILAIIAIIVAIIMFLV
tara:strand:+ start:18533 stop:18697 length:165 start_codon:yes stop_codon:yes gene_type:complete